jgi:large subunit ribosomal protein L19
MTEKKTASTEEKTKTPDYKPGMTVRVHQKIKELNAKGEEKERIQYFEGMIIAKKHGKEKGGTITVRKISDGVGVEKIFPLNLPSITKIEIKKQAVVKKSKLYFLKKGYKKKLKEVAVA